MLCPGNHFFFTCNIQTANFTVPRTIPPPLMIKALQTPLALRVESVADLAFSLAFLERKENFLSSAKAFCICIPN